MSVLTKDLNKVQLEAVKCYKGPSLIIAGAGSGKTRVLTFRVAYLLEQGINPENILALTFTNKAAREMKERVISLAGNQTAGKIWMGTFHSMFSKILRFEASLLGYSSSFSIYDTIDSKNLIKSIINDLKLDDNLYKPGSILNRISFAKNNLLSAQSYNNNNQLITADANAKREKTGEIYKIYSSRCIRAGAMDFDDLLLNTNILFRDFPETLVKYQNKFKYILVDEYQDTNFSQYLIIRKLSDKFNNLCVVGDDAQSIYSFRGARIENILNFKNDYPEHKLFKLEQNYRSTQNIVNAANSLIAKNKARISKNVWSKNEKGEKVKIIKALTDHEEGFIISDSIFETKHNKQLAYNDFAILYRTNAQSRIFEEALRKQNIPYRIYGSISFYQRKEIKDLIAYFRLCVNPNDEESIFRVINYPARGIGKTTMTKIENLANSKNLKIWTIISDIDRFNPGINKGIIDRIKGFYSIIEDFRSKLESKDAYNLAIYIADNTNILKDLHTDHNPENFSKTENIQELLNAIKEFTDNKDFEDKFISLDRYLENVSLLTNMDKEKSELKDMVSLMTIHSAKGLEFKYVYIAGLEEDLFPSQLSVSNQKELEEERRLLYVAITRAKILSTITYTKSRYRWGRLVECIPSRFIREIDTAYVDNNESEDYQYRNQKINTNFTGQFYNKKRISNRLDNSVKPPLLPHAGKFKRIDKVKPELAGKTSFEQTKSDISYDNTRKIEIGMTVEHQRFGIGTVLRMEGTYPNIKATVLFKLGGQKQLLLKFARLKIIKDNPT